MWVNIGSGKCLLLDVTKQLPEPLLNGDNWHPSHYIHMKFTRYADKNIFKTIFKDFHASATWENVLIWKCIPIHHLHDILWVVTYPVAPSNPISVSLFNTLRLRQNSRHFADDTWMKINECQSIFHWSLFLRVQLTTPSIGSDNGLAPTRWQAIIRTNKVWVYWCTYVSHGLNEFSW